MLVFDAEQMTFKRLDKEAIIWRTINGNHVPIPKYGTREEKAQAIKEWFASKNKDLPAGKGRISFYSARVEHEQPKRSARGTGEHAQVHGDGQYTLKGAENNLMNYFNKFGNSKRAYYDNLTNEENEEIKLIREYDSTNKNRSAESTQEQVKEHIKWLYEKVEEHKNKAKEYRDIASLPEDKMKEWLSDTNRVQEVTGRGGFTELHTAYSWFNNRAAEQDLLAEQHADYIPKFEKALEKYNELVESGKIKNTYQIYMVGDKVYRDDGKAKMTEKTMHFYDINRLYVMPVEQRKEYIAGKIAKGENDIQEYKKAIEELKPNEWNYHWYKREYERTIKTLEREVNWWKGIDYEHIVPAKTQMSKVRLPASKTYLREATGLESQSPYIKNAIKSVMVNEYGISELRNMGLGDVADKYEDIIDDALGLNGNHSSGEVLNRRLENVQKDFAGMFDYYVPMVRNGEEAKKLKDAHYLMKDIESRLKVSLLAKNNGGDTLTTNYGRGFYAKLGDILISGDYWHKYNSKDRKASDLLKKYGINGIAYRGHGVSRVSGWQDGAGNVTFDPKKMEVLERTTEREVIQRWIDKQNQIMGKQK